MFLQFTCPATEKTRSDDVEVGQIDIKALSNFLNSSYIVPVLSKIIKCFFKFSPPSSF